MRRLGGLFRPFRSLVRGFRATRRTVEVVPDLIDAILVLPTLSRQLEVIEFQTATLPEMYEEIARLRGDTRALVEVAVPLQATAARLGRLGDRWPQRRQLR